MSLWGHTPLFLKGHSDQEIFLRIGIAKLPLIFLLRKRIQESAGQSALPSSLGRIKSREESKMIERLKCFWCREAERVGTVHPGEGKAQWDFPCVYKYLVKEYKENKPDASQGHPMKGQEATDTKWRDKTLLKHKKKPQTCLLEGAQTLKQFVYGVSILQNTKDPSRLCSEQYAL